MSIHKLVWVRETYSPHLEHELDVLTHWFWGFTHLNFIRFAVVLDHRNIMFPKPVGSSMLLPGFFPPTVHLSSLPCFPTRNFSSPSTDRSRQYCLEACILLSGCWPGFWDPSACLASRKELLILSRPSSTIAPCTPIPNFPVVSTWVTSGHVIQLPSLHGSFWQPIYLPSNSP